MKNVITGHTPIKFEDYKTVVPPSIKAWNWYMKNRDGDVHIFEEWCLEEHVNYNGKIKIAMLGEVPDIYDYSKKFNPSMFHPYEWIKNNHHHFHYIMCPYTFLKNIVGEEKFIWAQPQNSFIRRENWGIYEKSKILSAVASHKQWTPGHKFRHKVINTFIKHIDVYGSGYNTIINDYDTMGKIIALAPYYFTIIVPNTNIDDWFSDQVTDAMLVGTIPVYCGSKGVNKFFNNNGIIHFDTIEDLEKIIPTLTKELYESKMDAVIENFEKAKHYETPADWLYFNKKDFLENIKI